jgi:Na+/H+ antiporter NhaD/arsenite permease-like protein
MLIGSFSAIGYRDFLWHLGPVALVGLFLAWFVLWFSCRRTGLQDVRGEVPKDIMTVNRAALLKPGIVIVMVLAGFLAGFAPVLRNKSVHREILTADVAEM